MDEKDTIPKAKTSRDNLVGTEQTIFVEAMGIVNRSLGWESKLLTSKGGDFLVLVMLKLSKTECGYNSGTDFSLATTKSCRNHSTSYRPISPTIRVHDWTIDCLSP